jgi:hypothetical protein
MFRKKRKFFTMDKVAYYLSMYKYPLKFNPIPQMRFIKKIYQYVVGRPMNRYEEDEIEIIINEGLSILIVSAIVICVVYMLTGIK